MSDTGPTAPMQPLGIGALFSETFAIFARSAQPAVLAAIAPQLLVAIVSVILLGSDQTLGTGEVAPEDINVGLSIFIGLLSIVAVSLTTAFIVRIAYDAKLGRSPNLAAALSDAASRVVVLAVVSLAVALMAGVATLAFILPGLWVYAVFSVAVPAVVVENAGFASFKRSVDLTRGYRWPIVFTLVVLYIGLILFGFLILFVAGAVASVLGNALGIAVNVALSAIPTAIFCTMLALIYARLREIKEGIGVESIASVFD
ncbi:MAG: hypothetical protein AAFR52_02160 [Pseudomonadota bacterium]